MFTAVDGEKFVKEKYGILPLSEISETLGKNIAWGVDRTLEKGVAKRLWPENLSYDSLVKSNDLMYRFLEISHRHPELFSDDVFDKSVSAPIGPETRMSNGLFFKQIEQYLHDGKNPIQQIPSRRDGCAQTDHDCAVFGVFVAVAFFAGV